MRLSVRENDAGYKPIEFCNRAVILLNGMPVKHCFTADEDLGEVRCFADPLRVDSRDCVVEVVLRGDVVILFPETLS